MEDRAYHHGHLRTVLLEAAERALREHGVERLSLRDLARQAGVSHAAPRRHFADRQALLDALAERGFARLADEASAAIDDAGADHQARLRGAATAFVRFAIGNAALLELMFTRKNDEPSAALQEASTRLFTTMGAVIHDAQEAGTLPAHDPERLNLLFAATLQGIAVLVTSGRAQPEQADLLVTDAVQLFASGRLSR
ncbi:TetR/AcrR family transcriptional regulator [Amycolatopsis australiensis]|uniref:DNA-binding transcriptional regulator, AcrR family n=1 Tax=Amycolatopsis australiensis TaxID=546364 RepID=A0A1K1T6U7_9PSEU|nr:TetR/AcrR family transcriptional regulator [Amycolatopsis australiensis]SFW92095.1 DNA-binding transcriptional regulator, AcrR family [Amycolatopsis australiensis]